MLMSHLLLEQWLKIHRRGSVPYSPVELLSIEDGSLERYQDIMTALLKTEIINRTISPGYVVSLELVNLRRRRALQYSSAQMIAYPYFKYLRSTIRNEPYTRDPSYDMADRGAFFQTCTWLKEEQGLSSMPYFLW